MYVIQGVKLLYNKILFIELIALRLSISFKESSVKLNLSYFVWNCE